jgi:phage terminase small subunit
MVTKKKADGKRKVKAKPKARPTTAAAKLKAGAGAGSKASGVVFEQPLRKISVLVDGEAKQLWEAPDTLSAEARQWWYWYVSTVQFAFNGLLMLKATLEAYDAAQEARRMVQADGAVLCDRFGQTKAHPMVAVRRDMLRLLKEYSDSLGVEAPDPGKGPGRPAGEM